jgi:hypothetical protein
MQSESIADVIKLKETESLSNIGYGFFSLFYYVLPSIPRPSPRTSIDLQNSSLAVSSRW